MVPLEVTHTALVTQKVLTKMLNSRQPVSPFKLLTQQLLTFFASTYKAVFNFDDPPLHDPCAVAYVIAPHIFEVTAATDGCMSAHAQHVITLSPVVDHVFHHVPLTCMQLAPNTMVHATAVLCIAVCLQVACPNLR